MALIMGAAHGGHHARVHAGDDAPQRTRERWNRDRQHCLVRRGALAVRSQATIDDVAWMEARITHHSLAIVTSERAHVADPRVRTPADGIVKPRRQEIGEIKALIPDLGDRR